MSDSDSDSSDDNHMDVSGGRDNVPNVPAANNNDEDNNSAASTEENYTQSEIEEKNDAIEKFLHVYEQYKSYQELLSKLEEAVDSDEKRDYYIRFAHHLLQCEENGMRLQELPMYSDKEYQMESLLVEYEESKKKEHTKDNVMQLSDNPWKTSGSETKMNTAAGIGMDLDSKEVNGTIPLEKLKELLFQPGMKWKGHIVVPGLGDGPNEEGNEMSDSVEDEEIVSMQRNRGGRNDNSNSIPNERGRASSNTDESNEGEESRKSYELVVYRTGEDPFGNYQIAASHAAYGDEQSVRIQLSTEEIEGSDSKKRLNVKYSDGETSCEGYWNEEKFRLEGNVRQKLQANDGIFHTSEVTHVFTLYPCTSCFPAGRDEEENTVASAATKKLTNQDNNSSIPLLQEDLLSRDTAAIAHHNNSAASTEENYTQSEIEEKNDAIEKFLHVYEQYKSYQELLSKLEEAVDSDEKRDYYIRFAHHLLQCEENGMRLQELPMYSDKEYQMESLLVEYEESKKKEHTKDNVMQLSDNPWKTSGSETKMNTAAGIGMDLDSKEVNGTIPLEKLKELLFQPGMKWKGHIVVPGLGDGPNEEGNEMSDSVEDEEIVSMQRNRGGRNDNSNSIPNERGRASSNTDESNEGEESRKSYELVVYRTGEDPFGNYQIAASHAAYGDEQSVRIQLSTEEIEGSDSKKRLNVKYSDGETSCEGYWNEEKFRLEGNVRQKLQANDGIFHTSEVTHVFTLYPCTSCFPAGRDEEENTVASAATKKLTNQDNNSSIPLLQEDLLSRDTAAIAAHRKRTEDVMKVCMSGFVSVLSTPPRSLDLERPDMMTLRMFLSLLEHRSDELSSIESQLNEKQKLYWKLRDVNFSEFLSQVHIVQGEHTCALFRSRAALLDSLHFDTIQDRDVFLVEWKEKKMDLKETHKRWDMVNFLMKYVAQMLATFDSITSQHQSLIFTSMHRLHVSYECLESAYRRAEKRLTREELTKYEVIVDRQHQEGLKNVDCIICQMPLLDEGEEDMSCLYKLPCSHCFHKKCVEQWLHSNSTCPACRLDLTNDN